MIGALRDMTRNTQPSCAENEKVKPALDRHLTRTITCIEQNPEVLIFNATWLEKPMPS